MFVELHIIQNFAPSNLNRDDRGAPKDCEFGGYRRARLSSQCIKRAIRRDSNFSELLAEHGGVRTRRLIMEIARRVDERDLASDGTVRLVADVFREGGIERPQQRGTTEEERDNTKLILFVDRSSLDGMAATLKARWDELKAGDRAARADVLRQLGVLLAHTVHSPDIALFGRMIEVDASTPFGKLNLGRDAACQVAHAISTHRATMEFDFFTAVEELAQPGEKGAAMMDTAEFTSACYYRYSNVDFEQLKRNLDGNRDLAGRTLEAFVRASISAVPTGKVNSTAPQNTPAFVLAVVRDRGLWSLANAFVDPVRPDERLDLVRKSIWALDRHWGQVVAMYGGQGIVGKWYSSLDGQKMDELGGEPVTVEELVRSVLNAVSLEPAQVG